MKERRGEKRLKGGDYEREITHAHIHTEGGKRRRKEWGVGREERKKQKQPSLVVRYNVSIIIPRREHYIPL